MVSQAPPQNALSVHERIFGKRPKPERTKIFGTTCLHLLKKIGPLGEGIAKAIKVPEKIFQIGDGKSFSSDENLDINPVIQSVNFDYSFPEQVPDYGIEVYAQGSSTYCTMVDSSRKVIVTADVKGLYGEEGEWETFAGRINDAVVRAENMAAEGKQFRFIVNNNGKFKIV